jgi:hypothetical protein
VIGGATEQDDYTCDYALKGGEKIPAGYCMRQGPGGLAGRAIRLRAAPR